MFDPESPTTVVRVPPHADEEVGARSAFGADRGEEGRAKRVLVEANVTWNRNAVVQYMIHG
ncbi:hypothetical protein [Rhodococcus sp. B50]|uniref:hypothetical protein n=1 Tax=Rhodococcus sp. B50 TaxID=2682847 RepID=UPI001A0C9CE7|nr:hypothetical protein [Rhodococcus sp. B50]MBS9371947.1 hypothetical protein [Rhodococcus sp. B50]